MKYAIFIACLSTAALSQALIHVKAYTNRPIISDSDKVAMKLYKNHKPWETI